MTEYCCTFLSRAILSSTRCLFFFFFLTATHLSGASRWGMMRVGARCVGLDSLLIGVHLGSPAAMNAGTPLRSQETFLTTFQRFFLPSGRRLQSAARLRRRWVGLAVTAPSGMNCLPRWLITAILIIYLSLSHLCNQQWNTFLPNSLHHVSFGLAQLLQIAIVFFFFFFWCWGGLIITLAQLYPWIIRGHLEDKPDQQVDRGKHLTNFCWIDFFFSLQQ